MKEIRRFIYLILDEVQSTTFPIYSIDYSCFVDFTKDHVLPVSRK